MRHMIRPIVLSALLLTASSPAICEVLDRILVIVNDEAITQRELDRRIEPLIRSYPGGYDARFNEFIKETKTKVLEELINDKILLSEAKRKNVEVMSDEVNEQMDKVKKQFPSDEAFYSELAKQNMTFGELKEKYRSNFMIKKLVDSEVSVRIVVSPSELIEYYEKNRDKYTIPKMAKVSSIVIKVKAGRNETEARKLAETVLEKINSGESFEELSKKYSDSFYASQGGDMGYVKEGEMKKDINDVIFSLKPGDVSEIIRTDLGMHIFKVKEIKGAETREFDAVNNEIEYEIFRNKAKEMMDKYITKLRENAYIEFK